MVDEEAGIDEREGVRKLCELIDIEDADDIIEQMRSACLWLWRKYNKRLFVYGHSAGGHLAACLVTQDWKTFASDAPADLVPAGYAISGVFDATPVLKVSANQDIRLKDEAEARAVSPPNSSDRSPIDTMRSARCAMPTLQSSPSPSAPGTRKPLRHSLAWRSEPETVNRYPLNHLLIIFQKICDAVSFAHSKGIIHRDLKTANAMIDKQGVVHYGDYPKVEDAERVTIFSSSSKV